jgi:hypothetical protein
MVLRAVLLFALPVAVLVGGGFAMNAYSGRKASAEAGTPINQRFSGYDVDQVASQWAALSKLDANLAGERTFLNIDLAFPIVYGSALAFSLLMAWALLSGPFPRPWLLMPVGVGMVADWVENLVLRAQLDRYVGGAGLDVNAIRFASLATSAKLLFLAAAYGMLLILAVWMIARTRKS